MGVAVRPSLYNGSLLASDDPVLADFGEADENVKWDCVAEGGSELCVL